LSIAHRGYVLANGRIAFAGSAAELRNSKLVQESFLAPRRTHQGSAPIKAAPIGTQREGGFA